MKSKKCKVCKESFAPWTTTQRVCSPVCALDDARAQQARQYKQKTLSMKRQFNEKDITYWKKRATKACHTYIRARDGNFCISCGENRPNNQIHAGHFRTRGAASQLQYHPFNIFSQCSRCNLQLSGNLIEYRKNLVNKVGQSMVDYIENENSVYKWTIEDYQGVEWWYKVLLRSLNTP